MDDDGLSCGGVAVDPGAIPLSSVLSLRSFVVCSVSAILILSLILDPLAGILYLLSAIAIGDDPWRGRLCPLSPALVRGGGGVSRCLCLAVTLSRCPSVSLSLGLAASVSGPLCLWAALGWAIPWCRWTSGAGRLDVPGGGVTRGEGEGSPKSEPRGW